jgi:hypothetical protein
MTTLQNDILEIYNSLVVFSDDTVKSHFPKPIKVWYEKDSRLLVFEQKGKSVRMGLPVYYCLDLEALDNKPTYLLPEDYDYLMSNLLDLLNSGELIKDRTALSPENYGFDIYATNIRELWKGPDIIGRVRFVSGTSWLFKFIVRRKYKL